MTIVTTKTLRLLRMQGQKSVGSIESSITNIFKDNIWNGHRAFIIGGGESLKNFDWNLLKNELTIGVNRAFEFFDPTIIFTMDARFLRWLCMEKRFGAEAFEKFANYKNGYICWSTNKESINNFPWMNYPNLHRIKQKGHLDKYGAVLWGDKLSEGLGTGANSGFGALNLAYCLGANPIYLLGFDMKGTGNGKQAWFHSGYPDNQREHIYTRFASAFDAVADHIKERVQVINLNPDSNLKCFEFDEFKNIPLQKPPIIISYYTKNTGYEKEIKNLIESMKRFSLPYDIEGIESLGSWQANTHFKARFIKRKLIEHKEKPLLFLDADAVLMKYPSLLIGLQNYDAGFHYYSKDGKHKQMCSGTLYFGNTPKSMMIVDEWIKENERNPDAWDQVNFDSVISRIKDNILSFQFNSDYCHIFDKSTSPDPVIVHHQASRRFKEEVNKAGIAKIDNKKEEQKEIYQSLWTSGYRKSKCAEPLIDYVKQTSFKNWKLLDIGCGEGTTVIGLSNLGFDISGIDITTGHINAKKELFFEAPIWEMPFPDDSFDYTFSTDVLEHIPPEKIEQAIREIYRITRIKSFHCIANFSDIRHEKELHLIREPFNWWQALFDRLKNKELIVKIMMREEFRKEEWRKAQ